MAKKFAPSIGLVTSAKINSCQKLLFPSVRRTFLFPHILISELFAALSGASGALLRSPMEAEKTEISAPVSAR